MAKMRIGRIDIHLRDPKKGMAYLEEGLKSDPDDANARTDLARGYELLGQWDKAVEEYQRALQVDGSLNRVHYILGRIYRQLGKADLAQQEYRLFQENEAREEKQHVNRIQRLRENAAGKDLP